MRAGGRRKAAIRSRLKPADGSGKARPERRDPVRTFRPAISNAQQKNCSRSRGYRAGRHEKCSGVSYQLRPLASNPQDSDSGLAHFPSDVAASGLVELRNARSAPANHSPQSCQTSTRGPIPQTEVERVAASADRSTKFLLQARLPLGRGGGRGAAKSVRKPTNLENRFGINDPALSRAAISGLRHAGCRGPALRLGQEQHASREIGAIRPPGARRWS
jgi:hypothetical protein